MKRLGKIIYLIMFLFIVYFGFIHIVLDKTEYLNYENRNVYEIDFDYSQLFKQGVDDSLEKALKDRLFRDVSSYYYTLLNEKLFFREFINNVRVKSPHIYDFTNHEKYSELAIKNDHTDEVLKNILITKNNLKTENKEFVAILVPSISSVYKYPKEILDPEVIDKKNAEYIYNFFEANDINFINTREILTFDDFFTTDHHINSKGANKILARLSDILNDKGISFSYDDDYNYKSHQFKGSRSRMISYLTETEEILEPIYNFNIKRYYDGHTDVNDFSNPSYVSYMCGDNKRTEIETDNNGPRVIIYGDSFSNVFESLILRSVKSMVSYDFRFGREDYADDADVVILICAENAFRLGEDYVRYLK